jgi:dolichyl-phosphate-mannose--protein O-mannosyl transferase
MSASARTAVAGGVAAVRPLVAPIVAIAALGLVIRLFFLPAQGFHNDIASFEAWTLTLRDNPPWQFYAKTSFADYPPGYFIVLWVLAGIYHVLGLLHLASPNDGSYLALRILVKLPALVMDFVDAGLIFAIVHRYASRTIALGAAAFYLLNPATIYVSAFWGQVDSISWGFILLGLWSALRSGDVPAKTTARLAWAWLAIAFSILIKPQGALVALVVLAFAFATDDADLRRRRLLGTGIGILGGLVMAYLAVWLFRGSPNPIADLGWLLDRYRFGSAVYPYNSINAFNLYAIKQPFWQSDLAPLVFFGMPFGAMYLWGIALVLAAAALIIARFLQQRTERAFLEAAMLVAFAFFVLATRMHERYIYGAFLLVIPLVAFNRRYWAAAAVLSFTALLNLAYSLQYQTVMENHTPNVDPTNVWPVLTNVLSAANVALFFVLGYVYLGGAASGAAEAVERDVGRALVRARAWFDPREGTAVMTRLDWVLAGAFTLASFIICIVWYQWPAEKIFDEIYYARAGEEYLKHVEIFEFTHPPLTKLIITGSMLLFGGLHGLGDTAFGWRFLNIVIGALSVGVLYTFAKRLLGSTLFASLAAAMLLFDGFHFVQSRIATPEITVSFFALCTLYAFYRVWTASAARRAAAQDRTPRGWFAFGVVLAVGALVAAAVATVLVNFGPNTKGADLRTVSWLVAFLYVETIFYLFARWLVTGGRGRVSRLLGGSAAAAEPLPVVVSYADGSRLEPAERGRIALVLPEGERIGPGSGGGDALAVRHDDEAERRYERDGRLLYRTPAATGTFVPAGELHVDAGTERGGSVGLWLVLLALAGGALAASKWNGLFDFFVVWGCTALVVGQRFLRRPALYGNPFGMPLDVMVGLMFAVGGAIYALCYIPFFSNGHNFVDMVTLQREMYSYHANLKATHPYASSWYDWPLLTRPISYFYTEYLPYKVSHDPHACCVAEILALPNPFVWWFGLASVPIVAALAWIERNRGYALLIVAYVIQWLPWIGSPRIAFEYHFYPNLAMIVLCNAIVLQKVWHWRREGVDSRIAPALVGIYMAIVVAGFAYFYPVLAGVHVPWDVWHARMWINRWII